MIPAEIPSEVRRGMLEPRHVLQATALVPGLSGAQVYRCCDRHGEAWALRRWPRGTTRARVDEVHRVITHIRNQGCAVVPAVASCVDSANGATIVHRPDGLWDLWQWMPGEAASENATLEEIRQGAAAIAQFHAASRTLGTTHQPAPAIQSRLDRLAKIEPHLRQLFSGPVDEWISGCAHGSEGLQSACVRAWQILKARWPRVRERIGGGLARLVGDAVPTQYVIRDVHREHVLFESGRVSGLIDFDALRVDTPMSDLARWVGSFTTPQRWDAALAGYCEDSPFSGQPRSSAQVALARELCFATQWMSLANWLVWLGVERRLFASGPSRVARRMMELIRLIESTDQPGEANIDPKIG